jgi:hypothetical protein
VDRRFAPQPGLEPRHAPRHHAGLLDTGANGDAHAPIHGRGGTADTHLCMQRTREVDQFKTQAPALRTL